MTEEIKLSDLQPDHRNANKGTVRGAYMVEQSLRKLGAGRSILLDKNGKIIAGNKTAEAAASIDLDDVVVVRTDGKKLVAVMREDLDLDDDTGLARELAYADNRASEVSLEFDPDVIAADLEMGVDLGDWFQDWELPGEAANDPYEEWEGMPEFESEDKTSFQSIHIHFKNREDVQAFAKLIDQKLTNKTRSTWYPAVENINMTDFYE